MKKHPNEGGCWFCHDDEGEMIFSWEFDCWLHEEYDGIMANMTIEQMAELRTEMVPIRHGWPSDTEYGYENDAGRTWDRETAIQAEIEWLKKEDDA
jgi:hypothetical protein